MTNGTKDLWNDGDAICLADRLREKLLNSWRRILA